MKRLALATLMLLLCAAPVLALQEAAPVEMEPAGDLTDQTTDMGITGLLTLGLTWGVRRWIGDQKLQERPHILAWTSIAASVLGGAATAYATGGGAVKPSEALLTAALGWITAQGGRRVKKLGGVK